MPRCTALLEHRLALVAREQGRLRDSLVHAEAALEAEIRHTYDGHPQTTNARGLIASILLMKGETERGKALHQRVIAELEASLGTGAPEVAREYGNFAQTLLAAGDLPAGLEYAKRAVSSGRAVWGDNSVPLARQLFGLGTAQWFAGEYAQAENSLREGLRIYDLHKVPDGGDRAAMLDNLAAALASQGKHIEADRLFRTSLPIWKGLSGEHSGSVMISMRDHARSLLEWGHHEEALEKLEEVVAFAPSVEVSPVNRAELRSVRIAVSGVSSVDRAA